MFIIKAIFITFLSLFLLAIVVIFLRTFFERLLDEDK